MSRAAQNIMTGEITTATRSVKLDGLEVREGQAIGLIDGVLKAAGEDPAALVLDLLNQMHTADREIITLYYGKSVSAHAAEALASSIRTTFRSQEVEVVDGGQPHYPYIISVE
jgi:uncharacterized protein